MEEFKNLKEIIELCKEELENNDENTHATLDLVDLKELKNLINKNKELEKMVELMADRLSYDAFYMDEASEYCEVKKKECDCYQNKLGCKECLLDYFRKKAKGE